MCAQPSQWCLHLHTSPRWLWGVGCPSPCRPTARAPSSAPARPCGPATAAPPAAWSNPVASAAAGSRMPGSWPYACKLAAALVPAQGRLLGGACSVGRTDGNVGRAARAAKPAASAHCAPEMPYGTMYWPFMCVIIAPGGPARRWGRRGGGVVWARGHRNSHASARPANPTISGLPTVIDAVAGGLLQLAGVNSVGSLPHAIHVAHSAIHLRSQGQNYYLMGCGADSSARASVK